MRQYFYLTKELALIRIVARQKPSLQSQRRSGTWIVNEVVEGKWTMPCFPEIMWHTLNKMTYLGSRPMTNTKGAGE